ncbi:MAG TPA: HEPN domain-containing protein [Anaerolineae bacterium]|nr:HEPN domain-containing protein [Anaerolineae bacterium]
MSDPIPVETPSEWLRFAQENLLVAERELGYEDPAFHTICFLCQSAAEKFLKGYLIARGWLLQKTHDIVVLVGTCSDYDEEFKGLLEGAAILNEYIVAARYPADLAFEGIGPAEAREAVDITRQIRALVIDRLAQQPEEPSC